MADDESDDAEDASLLDAVRTLIEQAGGVTAAARLLGKGRNTVDQWFKGRSKIPLTFAVELARQTGSGLDALAGLAAPTLRQSQVVMTTEAMPPEGFVPVPMIEVRASAGNGLVAVEPEPRPDVLSLRGDWLRQIGLAPGRAEAMFVTGDSMDPTIKDGDLILVDRQIDRVVDGGIYVLVVSGEVRVKRLLTRTDGAVVLKSDNAVWLEEVVPKDSVNDLVIMGRVRWYGRVV